MVDNREVIHRVFTSIYTEFSPISCFVHKLCIRLSEDKNLLTALFVTLHLACIAFFPAHIWRLKNVEKTFSPSALLISVDKGCRNPRTIHKKLCKKS